MTDITDLTATAVHHIQMSGA